MPVLRDSRNPSYSLPNRAPTGILESRRTDQEAIQDSHNLSVGDSYAGGTIIDYDSAKGVRVQTEDGKLKWLRHGADPALLPYVNDAGDLDLRQAVRAGFKRLDQLRPWNINQEDINALRERVAGKARKEPRAKTPEPENEPVPIEEPSPKVDKIIIDGKPPSDSPSQIVEPPPTVDKIDINGPPTKEAAEWMSANPGKTYDDFLKSHPPGNNKVIEVKEPAPVNEKVAPYVDGDKLDLEEAVRGGLTKASDYTGWDIDQATLAQAIDYVKRQDAMKRLEPFKTGENNYDIVKAVHGGASQGDLDLLFGVSNEDYILASFTTYKNGQPTIDVQGLSDYLYGLPDKTLRKQMADRTGIENLGMTGPSGEPSGGIDTPEPGPRALPEGVTQGDVNDMQKQLAELQAARAELPDTATPYDGTDNYARLTTINNQIQALSGNLDALNQYTSGTGGSTVTLKDLPTAATIAQLKAATDPSIWKYVSMDTNNQNVTSFNIQQAVKDGVKDDTLKAIGYSEGTLDQVKALNKVQGLLGKDGITSYDGITMAVNAGMVNDLRTLGVSEEDIDRAGQQQYLVDNGYWDKATGDIKVGLALAHGVPSIYFTNGLGVSEEAVRANQYLADNGYLDTKTGDVHYLQAVADGKEDYLIATGYNYNDIKILEAQLDDIKANSPELYDVLLKEGPEAYDKAIADYNAKIDEYNAKIDKYNADTKAENETAIAKFEESLKSDSAHPELWQVYKEKGYDAYIDATKQLEGQQNFAIAWMRKVGAATTDAQGNEQYDLLLAMKKLQSDIGGDPNNPKSDYSGMRENLVAVFGAKAVDTYDRMWQSQRPSIGSPSWQKPMSDAEYRDLIRPAGVSNSQWAVITPFIHVDNMDIIGAIQAGASRQTVMALTGCNNKDYDALAYQAKYESEGLYGKMGMTFAKDPKSFAENLVIGMIPIAGTTNSWNSPLELALPFHDKNTLKLPAGVSNTVSIVGDVLFFIPAIKGVSGAVKGGQGIGKAVLSESGKVVRDTILMPYNMVKHPISMVKSVMSPVETILNAKKLPLAVTWRGSYSASMDITKVLAGATDEERVLTMKAVGEVFSRAAAGEKSFTVPIGSIGKLEYKGSGLQSVLKNYVGSSTPDGVSFKGVGVDVNEKGLFMSPEHYLNLSFQSASGKAPLYAFNR